MTSSALSIARELVAQGLSFAEAGNFPEARASLENAVAADPTYEPAYAPLARQCLAMRDLAAAVRFASEGLRISPENIDCREIRAQARLGLCDFRGSSADADRVLARDGQRLAARMCKVDALLAQGHVNEAVLLLKEARKSDSRNVGILLVLGTAYQLQGDVARARDTYVEAGELEPLNWQVYLALAGLELVCRNHEAGLMAIDLAIGLGGETPTAHCLRGTFLTRLGRPEEAKLALVTALEGNPNDGVGWVSLAELEALTPSSREAAAKHARIAAKLAPDGNISRRAQRLLRDLGVAVR